MTLLGVTVLCVKPGLRHRPRATGAADGRGQGARGCLSSLLDCQKLEENLKHRQSQGRVFGLAKSWCTKLGVENRTSLPHPSPLAAGEPTCFPIFKFPAQMEMAEKSTCVTALGRDREIDPRCDQRDGERSSRARDPAAAGGWSRAGAGTVLTWSPRSSAASHTPAGKTAEGSPAAPGCSVQEDKTW